MIDSIAWWTDPTSSKLNDQLIDHLHLFHLFGDPLMKIPFPKDMTIACPPTATPGEIIQVTGTSVVDGPIYLELVKPRTRQATSVPERKKFELNEKTQIQYMKTYRVANNRAILYIPSQIVNGQFNIPVKIPDDLEGEYVFRSFGVHANGVAIGNRSFNVVPPKPKTDQQPSSQASPARLLPRLIK